MENASDILRKRRRTGQAGGKRRPAWRTVSWRRLVTLGLVGVLTFLTLAVARNIEHGDGDPVAYRVWTAPQAITPAPSITVAKTDEEWRQLWLKAGRTAPPFDPGHVTGVGIFLGERGGEPLKVNVVGAAQRGQRLVVTFEEVLRVNSERPAAPAAAPWAIIKVEKSGLPVSVEERIRQ